jgi:hypothetical protein
MTDDSRVGERVTKFNLKLPPKSDPPVEPVASNKVGNAPSETERVSQPANMQDILEDLDRQIDAFYAEDDSVTKYCGQKISPPASQLESFCKLQLPNTSSIRHDAYPNSASELSHDLPDTLVIPARFGSRAYAPHKERFSWGDKLEMAKLYLENASLSKIGGGTLPPKTVGLKILDVFKQIESVQSIHQKLADRGHAFSTSDKIGIDSTFFPLNSLGSQNTVSQLETYVIGDVSPDRPNVSYAGRMYNGSPTDSELATLFREFSAFHKHYSGNRVRQITIDNGVQLHRLIPTLLELFPGAEIQISFFQTKQFFKRELSKFAPDARVRTYRRMVSRCLDSILDDITEENQMKYWLEHLRALGSNVGDEISMHVLDSISNISSSLVTYHRLGTNVKTTNNIETINSILKNRVRLMRGFKSFESAKYTVNAILAYRLFSPFTASKEFNGLRPIDLCHNPKPPGLWHEYCFKSV